MPAQLHSNRCRRGGEATKNCWLKHEQCARRGRQSMRSRTNLWAGSNPTDCIILNIQNYWIKYDMSNEVEINFQISKFFFFCGCWNRFGLQATTSVHVLTIIWHWSKFRYECAICVGLTAHECVRVYYKSAEIVVVVVIFFVLLQLNPTAVNFPTKQTEQVAQKQNNWNKQTNKQQKYIRSQTYKNAAQMDHFEEKNVQYLAIHESLRRPFVHSFHL